MKLRSKAPILREWEGTGHVSTDPLVSPDGTPVLVIDGPKGGPVMSLDMKLSRPPKTNWRCSEKLATLYRTWGCSDNGRRIWFGRVFPVLGGKLFLNNQLKRRVDDGHEIPQKDPGKHWSCGAHSWGWSVATWMWHRLKRQRRRCR